MNTELTLEIDRRVVVQAQNYAKERGYSLSDMVENYLKATITVKKKNVSRSASAPIAKALRGSIKVPRDFDYKRELENELSKKFLL